MPLFNSMVQTLSRMAIQEAGVTIPQSAEQTLCEDVVHMLRSLPLLNEAEALFRVDMVPVKTSNRLGRYLIEAEDLSRYMSTNGIDDVKQAVCNILECNDLEGQYHNVAIVVDEASILEDMEEIGYAVSGAMVTPPKGLGLAMIGKQEDFSKIRRIANSKQLMDVLTGRYGLPLIRKNYKQVGFLEAFESLSEAAKAEDAELKVGKDDQVIHEDPKDKGSKSKKGDSKDDDIDSAIKEDDPKGGKPSKSKKDKDDDGSDNEAEKSEQPGDEDQVQEAAYSQMTAYELQIQRIKDIASGKMDDDFLV